MMKGLTADLLGRACRIFLQHAYPRGEESIPPSRRPYLFIDAADSLEPLLGPPICQPFLDAGGLIQGYILRLGSAHHPHLKLKLVDCDGNQTLVFAVDTHDGMLPRDSSHPEAAAIAQLQADNRRVKEVIEREWEKAGLLTFNALLRRQLHGLASDGSG